MKAHYWLPLAVLGLGSYDSAMAESYLGYSIKELDYAYQLDSTDAIQYEDSITQTVDFTLAIGDNYFFGLVLDLDQEQERSRQLLVKLGFGDLGAIIERGTIAGSFGTDSDHVIQPPQEDFEYDYEGFKLYIRDGWNLKWGITHASWTQPSVVELDVDFDESTAPLSGFEWVDPEVEYQFTGLFMTNNKMELLTQEYTSQQGWGFESLVEVGYMTIDTSGYGVDTVDNQTDGTVTQSTTEGIATRSTFRFGFYHGTKVGDTSGFAFSLGVEATYTGIVLGGRSAVDEYYTVTPSQYLTAWGPIVQVMGRF